MIDGRTGTGSRSETGGQKGTLQVVVEERGRLGRCTSVCVCLCVHECEGGIERLPSTLLCKLTGLDVQLTGLF